MGDVPVFVVLRWPRGPHARPRVVLRDVVYLVGGAVCHAPAGRMEEGRGSRGKCVATCLARGRRVDVETGLVEKSPQNDVNWNVPN
jgi:hypothetical protein